MDTELERSRNAMMDNIHQLQLKKGPYYNKWLRGYRQAVDPICKKSGNRWAQGMKAFLDQYGKQ